MYLPSGSHTHHLCQPANGRAGWPAVTCIKEAIWPAKSCSFGKEQLSTTHREGSFARHIKTGDPTARPWCLVDRAHHRSSRHTASSRRPTTAPATSCRGLPWPSSHKPSRALSSTPSPTADRSLLHITPQRRQPSGPVASHPAGSTHYTPCCRP